MTRKEIHITKEDLWRANLSVLFMLSLQRLRMMVTVMGCWLVATYAGSLVGIVGDMSGVKVGLLAGIFLVMLMRLVMYKINLRHFYRLATNTVPDGKIEYIFDQEQCTVVSGGSTRSYPWSDSIDLMTAFGIGCIEVDGDYGGRRLSDVFFEKGVKSVPPELSFPIVWYMPSPTRKFLIIPLRCVDQTVLSTIRAAVSHYKSTRIRRFGL